MATSPFPNSDTTQRAMNSAQFGLQIDQRVDVYQKCPGYVRFVGEINGHEGTWVGVELDKPQGKNNGSVDGMRLFQCPENHGVFTRPHRVSPCNEVERAATTIQAAARARRDSSRAETQQMFSSKERIETSDEGVYLQTNNTLLPIDHMLAHQHRDKRRAARPSTAPVQNWQQRVAAMPVDSNYNGLHLPTKLAATDCEALREFLQEESGILLHTKYVLQLLHSFKDLLKQSQSCALARIDHVPTQGDDEELWVLGDTHGQLNDVLWLFHEHGPPSETRTYLFNGDVADRGDSAVEILLMIFAYKLVWPGCIHINRGNHEAREMNTMFGFSAEVRSKYKGTQVLNLFQSIFDLLPLATVIADKVIVVHGGIPRKRSATLEQIEKIDYRRDIPPSPDAYQDSLFFDMLWSDPFNGKGIVHNKQRGGGTVMFGSDVSKNFLDRNNLTLCIRSHEVPSTMAGWEDHHDNRVMTVFSASNYCGDYGNWGGAVQLMRDPGTTQIMTHVFEHFAPSLQHIAHEQGLFKDVKERWERTLLRASAQRSGRKDEAMADVLKGVAERVIAKRESLQWYFEQLDEHHTGYVTELEWRDAMDAVLELQLPWKQYQEYLVQVESGKVDYSRFLRRYRVVFEAVKEAAWIDEARKSLRQVVASANLSCNDSLRLFDQNATPRHIAQAMFDASHADVGLSVVQLERVVSGAMRQTMEPEEAELTLTRGASVAALRAEQFSRSLGGCGADPDELNELAAAMQGFPGSSVALFNTFDKDADGFVQIDEFVAAFEAIFSFRKEGSRVFNTQQLHNIATQIDTTQSGHISYLEFCNALFGSTAEDHKDNDAVESTVQELMHHLYEAFYENRVGLRRAFRFFDVDHDGTITPSELKAGIEVLNSLISQSGKKPFSSAQVASIAAHLDRNSDGMIDYEEFLDGFKLSIGDGTIEDQE